MEQIEPIATTESAKLPVVEPKWNPEKAAKRKVKVVKVPYGQDPMKEKTVFEFGGFVYICYAKKTRGRSMIRCLGMTEVEREPPKLTPYEAGKLLDAAGNEDHLGSADLQSAPVQREIDKMSEAIKDSCDDEVFQDMVNSAVKENEGDFDAMGEVLKEAIDDDIMSKVVKDAEGDG